jgi:hypothetical protein
MWGGFRPYGAKSMRAKDMPKVLRPSILSILRRVTVNPSGFDVSLGMFSPDKKKSLAETSLESLQNFPFTNTAWRRKSRLYKKNRAKIQYYGQMLQMTSYLQKQNHWLKRRNLAEDWGHMQRQESMPKPRRAQLPGS